MPKILFLFLALLLNCISNLQTSLNSDQTEAIEVKLIFGMNLEEIKIISSLIIMVRMKQK